MDMTGVTLTAVFFLAFGVFAHAVFSNAGKMMDKCVASNREMVKAMFEERTRYLPNSIEAKQAQALSQALSGALEQVDKANERMLQLTEDGRKVLELRDTIEHHKSKVAALEGDQSFYKQMALGKINVPIQPEDDTPVRVRDGEVQATFARTHTVDDV